MVERVDFVSVVDTGDGGVTLAEGGFVLRWHPDSKSCVSFAPLDSSLQSGVDKWEVEAVFSTVDLFDVWFGKSRGFNCERVLFRLTGQGLAFEHVDGLYSGGFWGVEMEQFCRFVNERYVDILS